MRKKIIIFVLFSLAAMSFRLPMAFSATVGDYNIVIHTTDGGGGLSSVGDYTLIAAVGQPDVGTSCSGDYVLSSGLWAGLFSCDGQYYKIAWFTIDGGGGVSSIDDYALIATVGQHDTGLSSVGDYSLSAGFWPVTLLCIVDLEDFARFAAYWLDGPCDASNNWCGGADLNRLDDVNITDLTILANQWLNICPIDWPLK